MKNNRMKLIPVLMVLFACMCVSAIAQTSYPVWAGGKQFTSEKMTVSGATGTATLTVGADGAYTLTLDNYTSEEGNIWEGEEFGWWREVHGAAISNLGSTPLKLVLKGDSRVVGPTSIDSDWSDQGCSYGVYSLGRLEVSGTGSLTAIGGDDARYFYSNSYGVYSENGITVSSGNLMAVGGKGDNGYGVSTLGGITVSGTGSLTGQASGGDWNTGVSSYYDGITVTDNGSVTGQAGDSWSSVGVASYGGGITVSGNGSLTGKSGSTQSDNSIGVDCSSFIHVSEQGSLQGSGGDVVVEGCISVGVWGMGDICVSGNGTVTGTGGRADGEYGQSWGVTSEYSCIRVLDQGSLTGVGGDAPAENGHSRGVGAYEEEISVSDDGRLTGLAGKCNAESGGSYGIYCFEEKITISGGVTTAQGGTQAISCKPTVEGGLKVWYGATKEAAEAAGAKIQDEAAENYFEEKYVRIEIVPLSVAGVPHTGDAAAPALWLSAIVLSMMGMAFLRRKAYR